MEGPPAVRRRAARGLDDLAVASRVPHPLGAFVVYSPDVMASLRPDLNDGLEIGIVLDGWQERQWQDYTATFGPGDVWFGGVLEPHAWRFAVPGASVSLEFLPSFLGDDPLGGLPWLSFFTVPVVQRPRTTDAHMRREVLAIGEEIRRETEERPHGWVAALKVSLLRLLVVTGRDWSPPEGYADADQVLPRDLQRLRPALEALQADLTARLGVETAAAACGLSVAHFNRLFRRILGTTFSEFALRARVAAAAEYLLRTDLTTSDIAARVGFSDHSHLHRMFLRYYRCTPRHYRLRRGVPLEEGDPAG